MQEILEGNFKSSCNAFVVFDSYESMLLCLKAFNESTFENCKVMCQACKNFFSKAEQEKMKRTLSQLPDEQELLMEEYEQDGMTLHCTMPRDPIDIIWYNLGGTRGYYFMRRYCWNIIGIFLILFVSTPAVIFQTLKSISQDHINLEILYYIPFVESYSKYIPTLIVLVINLLLLILIDQAALAESNASHYKYQSSVFGKAVIYLHLNMVLFPFLGLQEAPIYKVILTEGFQKKYIQDFSMLDSTPFFTNLIVQLGVFGGLFYLLRIGEVIMCNFSPAMSNYIRNKFTTTQSWRRRPDMSFQYGYFYSQIATVFTIVILFSSTAPIIALVGAGFYIIRNIIDAHLLMSVHKKEIDSGVKFFQRIISWLLFSLICYQLCMIVYFYLNDSIVQCYVITFML